MKEQPDMFDLMGAREARDLGIERVEGAHWDWIQRGMSRIAHLPRGYEGIGEEICRHLDLLPAPSPGAVGALIRSARDAGLLVRTGRMKSPECVKSHARATYVWRRT